MLCVLLLLVGGGFGPPLIGVGRVRRDKNWCRSPAASRAFRPGRGAALAVGRLWPWILGAGVLGDLSLLPGTVPLGQLLGVDNPGLVYAHIVFSFAGLILALAAARVEDHVRAGYGG